MSLCLLVICGATSRKLNQHNRLTMNLMRTTIISIPKRRGVAHETSSPHKTTGN